MCLSPIPHGHNALHLLSDVTFWTLQRISNVCAAMENSKRCISCCMKTKSIYLSKRVTGYAKGEPAYSSSLWEIFTASAVFFSFSYTDLKVSGATFWIFLRTQDACNAMRNQQTVYSTQENGNVCRECLFLLHYYISAYLLNIWTVLMSTANTIL